VLVVAACGSARRECAVRGCLPKAAGTGVGRGSGRRHVPPWHGHMAHVGRGALHAGCYVERVRASE